jgi:two-component system response regulator AtoC
MKPDEPIERLGGGPEPWKAEILRVLTALRERLGPDRGRQAAEAGFAECLARVFGAGGAGGETAAAKPPRRADLRHRYDEIVGESDAILGVLATLDRVIDTELPVLITGESGTGKELVARAIHENGPRRGRAFVRENCAAIPETLLESELFGYRRGAFTGAVHDKKGLFEEGDGGSVFLDEIGEMPLSMQAKLMRVLQEGEIRPVGASTSLHVDVRVISATNRDLRALVAAGGFREDLFFRLNVLAIHMPALRDHPDDIPLLAKAFLDAAAARTGRTPKTLEPAALEALMRYLWPGNVRELENEVQRAFALSGPVIRAGDFSGEVAGLPARETRRRPGHRPA